MPKYDYDLFVIGAGSGGVRASRMAAGFGARVAIAEQKKLGGTCVNVGCIPKKLLVYASHYADDFEDAAGFGWSKPARELDWATLIRNKNEEIDRLNGVYGKLLKTSGVELMEGRAQLVDAHTFEVDGRRATAEHILVAVGGRVHKPHIPGFEHTITSDQAFFLDELPKRVVVAGGGYIGVEFAGIFHGLGSEVALVHRGDLFLRGFDDTIRSGLAEEMKKQGVSLRFQTTIERIEKRDTGLELTLSDDSKMEVDQVLCAMGRVPNTSTLGLDRAGVELDDKGAIVVDEYSRTSTPNIWAVGDVTDRLNLTPMAIAEAAAMTQTAFNDNPTKPDHHDVPTAVFSHPNIGTVGLTETEARERFEKVVIYRSTFTPLKHRLTKRPEQTVMKLIVDGATDRVIGCHMLGADAGEIIQGFAVALKCGATKKQFDATIGIHPTAAEEFVTMRAAYSG